MKRVTHPINSHLGHYPDLSLVDMDGADRVYWAMIVENPSSQLRAGRETVEAPEHSARELCHLWGLSHLHGWHPLHPSRLRMGVKGGHHVSRSEVDTIPQLEMGN
jgi:hypothetical protein